MVGVLVALDVPWALGVLLALDEPQALKKELRRAKARDRRTAWVRMTVVYVNSSAAHKGGRLTGATATTSKGNVQVFAFSANDERGYLPPRPASLSNSPDLWLARRAL